MCGCGGERQCIHRRVGARVNDQRSCVNGGGGRKEHRNRKRKGRRGARTPGIERSRQRPSALTAVSARPIRMGRLRPPAALPAPLASARAHPGVRPPGAGPPPSPSAMCDGARLIILQPTRPAAPSPRDKEKRITARNRGASLRRGAVFGPARPPALPRLRRGRREEQGGEGSNTGTPAD